MVIIEKSWDVIGEERGMNGNVMMEERRMKESKDMNVNSECRKIETSLPKLRHSTGTRQESRGYHTSARPHNLLSGWERVLELHRCLYI